MRRERKNFSATENKLKKKLKRFSFQKLHIIDFRFKLMKKMERKFLYFEWMIEGGEGDGFEQIYFVGLKGSFKDLCNFLHGKTN